MKRNVAVAVFGFVILAAGVALGAAVVSGDTHQGTSHTAEVDECTAAYDLLNGGDGDPDGPTVPIAVTGPRTGVVSLEYTVPDRAGLVQCVRLGSSGHQTRRGLR